MRAFRDLISVGFRNLLRNSWFPVGWGGFLCLNIRAALDSFVACALSMGLVVAASCCLPALSSPWKQCGRGERLGVTLSTMAVLQVLIVSFLQQLVATGGVLRKLGLLFQWQLWPIVVVAVGGALVAAPAVGVLVAWFWRVDGPKVAALWRGMDRTERAGMVFIALCLAGIVSWAYSQAAITELSFDVIYTSDGTLANNAPATFTRLAHGENDFRQPLFAVCALPFVSPFLCLRDLLLPVVTLSRGWCVAMAQVLLVMVAFGWLVRLMALRGRLARLGMVAWLSAGYATLLMCTQVEQYVVALFWLLFFLNTRREEKRAWVVGFVGATGSLLTSAALALAHLHRRDVRAWRDLFCQYCYAGVAFVGAFVLFCRMDLLATWAARAQMYLNFTGKTLDFMERLRMWLAFVTMNFCAPEAGPTLYAKKIAWHLTADVSPQALLCGTLLLGTVLVGSLLCWRERFVRVCTGWVIFSWLLLCLIGWGTAENGLILYVLYFSWAFVGLAAKLIERIVGARFAGAVYLLLAALTAWNTLPAFAEMVHFLAQSYPAQ